MKNNFTNRTNDILDTEKTIEESRNFPIGYFQTDAMTHAPREVFALYSEKNTPPISTYPHTVFPSMYALVWFNIHPSFNFYGDFSTQLPGFPQNGELTYFREIESIESNVDGILLADQYRNIIARINAGEKVTNLYPGNKFYITSDRDFTQPYIGAPNVKVILKHYTRGTSPIYKSIEDDNFKVLEDE